ncbi:MAG TPA: flagellar hook-length control protein FliK [Bradyrhizobium sp.]|nr:flagellar hook-length control protein FliK [Bradyrhizobium sp.]
MTSETAANLSVPNAPARSARADQTPAPDSFSALIDSNAADTAGNDRTTPTAPDRPSQRPDEPSTTSDGRQPRDAASSSKAAAKTPSQDEEPNAAQPACAGSNADAGAVSKPVKPGAAKTGIVKAAVKDAASDIVAATDPTASADPAASAQAAAATSVTPAAVAALIAVPAAATDIVAARASPAGTTEPLAIAAAAIATSTSTVEASKPVTAAVQGLGDQPKPASAPALPATTPSEAAAIAATPVAATTDVAVPAAAGAINAQTSTADPIASPVNQPAAKADAVVEADPELAAAVAAATPDAAVTPKATPKPTIAARPNESAASINTGIQPHAADPPSPSSDAAGKGVAPQGPATDGKPKADGGAVDAAKTAPANTDAPASAAATAAPHEHRAVAAQVQTDTPDVNQAANAVQQPQAPSATTPVATQLTVTAATTAAVPLNGLALQIAVTAQSGKSRFEIRLDPAELGRIDLRIDVDRHGQLTSHLTVEKPETLAMLRQDAPQLQRALDNAGFKTGDGGLQFSLRDQSSSGQNTGNETDRNAQRLIISEDDTIPASVAGRTYGRMSGSGSGVDIRV